MKKFVVVIVLCLFLTTCLSFVYDGKEYPTGTEIKKISKIRFPETFEMEKWRTHKVIRYTLNPDEEYDHTVIRLIPKQDLDLEGEKYITLKLEVDDFWGTIDLNFAFEKKWLEKKGLKLSDFDFYQGEADEEWEEIGAVTATSEDEDYYYFVYSIETMPEMFYGISTGLEVETITEGTEPEEGVEIEQTEEEETPMTGQVTQTVASGGDYTWLIILITFIGTALLGFGAFYAYNELTLFKSSI